MNCIFRQFSCIILRHKQALGGIITRPFDIYRWNVRTRPPIRISDISSWTYDKNSFFVNPARYERQWNKSYVDSAITGELLWWKLWCREINSSPDILGCCVFESWLYCKFEHNRFILRDLFGEMLQHAPCHGNSIDLDGIPLNGCKYTTECRVACIHRKPLQMHNYEYQTHHQTQFWSQAIKPSRSSTAAAPVAPSTSAMKKHHNIWIFVDVSNYMIGKVYKRLNFI